MEDVLRRFGVGVRPIDDAFFDDAYGVCKVFERQGITIEDEESFCHKIMKEFPCHSPECKATFQTLIDFEMHYNSCHRYICSQCKQSRPTPRLLDIHIQETHDSFFKVLCEKQPMYQCYVSDCDLRFNNPSERKIHCVDVHKFPKNYRYDNSTHWQKENRSMEVDQIDQTSKQKQSNQVQLNKNCKLKMFNATSKKALPTISHNVSTISTPTVTNSSSLQFIPRQLKNSYTKALTNNQSKATNILEEGNMMDLAESLPQ